MMDTNILTIDTEDWFQVFYGSKAIPRENWTAVEPKIAQMVDSVLDLLSRNQTPATFFIVGWIAERNPSLIRLIAGEGHEIASHSHWHTEVFRQSRSAFAKDVRRAKHCLEDAGGVPVKGFRAPGFSIRKTEEWALDAILEAGHAYDSSLLYVSEPFGEIRPSLYEVAPNSINVFGTWLPTNGGFFFRMVPYALYKPYVSFLNARNKPLVFYTHTWEIFLEYPRLPMSWHKRFIQYTNLRGVKTKIERLCRDFKFTTVENYYFSKQQNHDEID